MSIRCEYQAEDTLQREVEILQQQLDDARGEIRELKQQFSEYHEKQQVTELQLKQQKHALKRSQELAHVGDWSWTPRTNKVHWSDEMFRIFGVDQETFTGDLNMIIAQAIYPDDREILEAANRKVIEEQTPTEMEYRVVWPDGSIHHVWAHPDEPVLDNEGNVLILSGIVQDITARKETEKKLREKVEELERWYEATVSRETRHLELKHEVNVLLQRLGEPIRYDSAEL